MESSKELPTPMAHTRTPFRLFLQTAIASVHMNLILYLPFIAFFWTGYFLIKFNFIGRALLLVYFAYIYYDHKTRLSAVNGNGLMFMRNNFWTNHVRDYYPIDLVKTAELPPTRNYLVVCFPHGIIGTGVSINMAMGIGKWLQLFPGVRPKVATLDSHFTTPLMRDLFRSWGLISCCKESLVQQLSKSNDPKDPNNKDGFTSNAVGLLVGGSQEALDSRPGHYEVTLKNRKGFVKIAIKTGSAIVPSFSFGEVDILDQVPNPPGSRLRKIQLYVKKMAGVSPLIVVGRGFWRYVFGFLTHRKPIVQVMGTPIEVRQMDEPSADYVNEVHQKVVDSICELFEKHKHKYIENADETQLIIN